MPAYLSVSGMARVAFIASITSDHEGCGTPPCVFRSSLLEVFYDATRVLEAQVRPNIDTYALQSSRVCIGIVTSLHIERG